MEEQWHSAAQIKPAPEQRVVAAARDDIGRYILPWPVRYRGGRWYNARTGTPIDAFIVRWRNAQPNEFRPAPPGEVPAPPQPKQRKLLSVFDGDSSFKAELERSSH